MEHDRRHAQELPSATADLPASLTLAVANELAAAEQHAQEAELRLRQLQHRYQALTRVLGEWTWTTTLVLHTCRATP